MADKKKHADGYGSQKWIVKDEVRAKAGLELADVIFTPEKARKAAKKATAAVSAVTAAGSASVSVSATSPPTQLPVAATTPTHTAKDITETSATVSDGRTGVPPVTQTQSKTQAKGTQSPVKKVPSSKGPSSTHRTPSTSTSTAAKSTSLLRFFNKPVAAAEKGSVSVPVPTQDPLPVTDTTSGGEDGRESGRGWKEGGEGC
jgi:hypothetical protein